MNWFTFRVNHIKVGCHDQPSDRRMLQNCYNPVRCTDTEVKFDVVVAESQNPHTLQVLMFKSYTV